MVCCFSCPASFIPYLSRLRKYHFKIWTQLETWCLRPFRLLIRVTKKLKNKIQKDRNLKRQRPEREFNIVMSGQFHTPAMFFLGIAPWWWDNLKKAHRTKGIFLGNHGCISKSLEFRRNLDKWRKNRYTLRIWVSITSPKPHPHLEHCKGKLFSALKMS